MAKTKIEIVRRRIVGIVFTTLVAAAIVVAYANVFPLYPRHPYLSGWLLFLVMLFLTFFNLRKKVPFLRLGTTSFWLQLHVYIGILSGVLFLVHSNFSWPHGLLNQILFVCFTIVFLTGIVGLWISREFPKRLTVAGFETPFERIPQVRNHLRTEAEALVLTGADGPTSPVIADFYTKKIGLFFTRHENFLAHLQRSRTAQASHLSQFDEIERYAKKNEIELLNKLADLVAQKHLLDYQYTLQLSLRVWLFAHIPLSYSLLILSVTHIIVVYSFSGSAP